MSDVATVPHSLRDRRRLAIAHSATQRGLDHIEVEQLAAASRGDSGVRKFRLRLNFVPNAPGVRPKAPIPPGIGLANLQLTVAGGGDPGLRIVKIPESEKSAGEPRHVLEVIAERVGASPREATPGGTIVYTLSLTGIPHLDRFFTSAAFTLEGLPPPPEELLTVVPASSVRPTSIDYLAKDYESFRRLLLERMTLAVPGWTERNPADFGIAVVEVLAYAADDLSYYQDAVGAEAYLGTARRRTSLARHARLLDYSIGNGTNARTWLQVDVTQKTVLKRGTPVYAQAPGAPAPIAGATEPIHQESYDQGFRLPSSNTFEILADTPLVPEHLTMTLYTWGAMEYTLPAGTTSAALAGCYPELDAGDVLILAPADSTTGKTVKNAPLGTPVRLAKKPKCSIDPAFDAPITEIVWFAADALPTPLPVAGRVAGSVRHDLALVLGNLAPIDQGQTVAEELPPVLTAATYAPMLANRWITQAPPFDPVAARRLPATEFLHPDSRHAMPVVELSEISATGERVVQVNDKSYRTLSMVWRPLPDLLGSGPFAYAFVVEIETDGSARLRFGDGQYGRRPLPGTRFLATYRIGLGADGNLGPGTIDRLDVPGVAAAGNPLQAAGGANPEDENRIRLMAPQALAAQERCVTEADFIDAAESYPGVRRADASWVWTGSWTTAFVYVERENGRPFDRYFEAGLYAWLEPRVLAGTALRILPPCYLPLDIALVIHLRPAALRFDVERALRQAFSAVDPAGFFAVDRFTFGQPVYLSEVIARAAAVSGVAGVQVLRFQRWGQPPRGEIAAGCIQPEPLEIVRAESVAGAPQLGVVEFQMERPQ
ncbi:MAG TPA: putative baseplate assembly protein [Thermoanaerobaculia bacterium]|jgi:hypothetical protein|nr:putative baseplate assembly protein [Thermoanaerobaculia bacterium]